LHNIVLQKINTFLFKKLVSKYCSFSAFVNTYLSGIVGKNKKVGAGRKLQFSDRQLQIYNRITNKNIKDFCFAYVEK